MAHNLPIGHPAMGKNKRKIIGLGSIVLSALMMLPFTSHAQVQNQGPGGVPRDKAMHFGVAAGAQAACYTAARTVFKSKWGSQIGCFVAVNTAGVMKELGDPERKGTQEVQDIYANLAGSGLSFTLIGIVF
jgi:hypothetical protein